VQAYRGSVSPPPPVTMPETATVFLKMTYDQMNKAETCEDHSPGLDVG
jgi:hypothetical protein